MEEVEVKNKLSVLTLEVAFPLGDERYWMGRVYYDCQGRPLRQEEELRLISFYYDGEGRLSKKHLSRNGGSEEELYQYEYGGGVLLGETLGEERTLHSYNGQGLLEKSEVWQRDVLESLIHYNYDGAGRLLAKEHSTPEGLLLQTSSFRRDEGGRIIETLVVGREKRLLDHCEYNYTAFYGEDWLVREKYRIEEGRGAFLEETIYRSLTPLPEETLHIPEVRKTEIEVSKTLVFQNGEYRGELNKEGQPEGVGEFHHQDGSVYRGGFARGLFHGQGSLEYQDGRCYRGEFQEGCLHGKGECSWNNGDHYKGSFYKGELHGEGTIRWANGKSFSGVFSHNQRTDQGVLNSSDD